MELFLQLLFLILIEVILSADNMLMIGLLTSTLPAGKIRRRIQNISVLAAAVIRIVMLFAINWLTHFTKPLVYVSAYGFTKLPPKTGYYELSVHNIIYFVAGLYLAYCAIKDLFKSSYVNHSTNPSPVKNKTWLKVLLTLLFINVIFSFDSVFVAVSTTKVLWVSTLGIIVGSAFLYIGVGIITNFITKHFCVRIFSLSVLLLISANLISESLEVDLPAYLFVSCGLFAVIVQYFTFRGISKSHNSKSWG